LESRVNNLHFDVKSMDIHAERNRFTIKAKIHLSKIVSYEPQTYDNIFLPMTLNFCLVVKNGIMVSAEPPYKDQVYDAFYQDIEITGTDLGYYPMVSYWECVKQGTI